MNTAERAAVYGTATPVPWAPWDQLDPVLTRARENAEFAAIDFVRHLDDGVEFDREYAVRRVAEYDALRAAADARKAAILAVTS